MREVVSSLELQIDYNAQSDYSQAGLLWWHLLKEGVDMQDLWACCLCNIKFCDLLSLFGIRLRGDSLKNLLAVIHC